ncbi:Brefeldin A-inhibited guanine nucleotide-exchange protein 3 [Porphyridium purpureum]|uniref:Brefeldin A-inhibited guanine nucleotide-exchange protein 3 n=1 Tax=Porphyridium purpureum TaxID=35688 RepID=A0A5J4YWY0_PORPP|nr:Brefeldin A-inhibited guanine nucleotide-exchange protein 3 [Porphyridium purpureum]|eukprot:POR5078..scf209_3
MERQEADAGAEEGAGLMTEHSAGSGLSSTLAPALGHEESRESLDFMDDEKSLRTKAFPEFKHSKSNVYSPLTKSALMSVEVEASESPSPVIVPLEHDRRTGQPPTSSETDLRNRGDEEVEGGLNDGSNELADFVYQIDEQSLAEFADITGFFMNRIVSLTSGRKYKDLRAACRQAACSAKDRSIEPHQVRSDCLNAIIVCLQSQKVVAVEACLDYVNTLMEKRFFGGMHQGADAPKGSVPFFLDKDASTYDEILRLVYSALEVGDDAVYLRLNQLILTATCATQRGLHDTGLLLAAKTLYNTFLNMQISENRDTARKSLLKFVESVFSSMERAAASQNEQRMQAQLGKSATSAAANASLHVRQQPGSETENEHLTLEHEQIINNVGDSACAVYEHDAYIIFRSFCKLASRDVPDGTPEESIAIRSKHMALELLNLIVSGSGHNFRVSKQFLYGLKCHLAPALITSCLGTVSSVVDLSLSIMETLILRDSSRAWLKFELETLCQAVIFRFIESSTAGFLRRRRALVFLARIYEQPQVMVDFFVNYDCDLASPHIFARSVMALCAALRFSSPDELHQNQVRRMALDGILQVLSSLKQWCGSDEKDSTDISPDAMGSAGSDTSDDQTVGHTHSSSLSPSPLPGAGNQNGPSMLSSAALARRDSGKYDETSVESNFLHKRQVESGVELFNRSPKKGVKFWVQTGLVSEESPAEVARFLGSTAGLDATTVGEYLGEVDAFNVAVMHAYTDAIDFQHLEFDEALRRYLMRFRLPGESQKIERIIEKFAHRYCECNPETFANADTALILGYSIIMLNTDQHNEQVKKKMSKDEFVRNNRGINDGRDLHPAFLGGIYDRILAQPLKLGSGTKDSKQMEAQSSLSRGLNLIGLDAGQKSQMFKAESEKLLDETRHRFSARKRKPGDAEKDYMYITASDVGHARLMFESIWHAVLASLSIQLEQCSGGSGASGSGGAGEKDDDLHLARSILDAFKLFIQLATDCVLLSERDVLVASLSRFAHPHDVLAPRKTAFTLRTLLLVASRDGVGLGDFWPQAIKYASWIAELRADVSGRLQTLSISQLEVPEIKAATATGTAGVSKEQEGELMGDHCETALDSSTRLVKDWVVEHAWKNKDPYEFRYGGVEVVPSEPGRNREAMIAFVGIFDDCSLTGLFSGSDRYSFAELLRLVDALLFQCASELRGSRTFCLVQFVRVLTANLRARSRIEWMQLWERITPFVTSCIVHPNLMISVYSIHMLTQLYLSFVQLKEELTNFSFQRRFLDPFVDAFGTPSCNAYTKEVILESAAAIVFSPQVTGKMHSGWKPIFAVFSAAAQSSNIFLRSEAFRLLENVLRGQNPNTDSRQTKSLAMSRELYLEVVTCLTAFSSCPTESISIAALEHLTARCPFMLTDGQVEGVVPVCLVEAVAAETKDVDRETFGFDDHVDEHVRVWLPTLLGLSNGVYDSRPAVRDTASDGIFQVLYEYGGLFSRGLWSLLFRGVLRPMFDEAQHLPGGQHHARDADNEKAASLWSATTGASLMNALIEIWVAHYARTRHLFKDILSLIRCLILQESELVAREGIRCLRRLLTEQAMCQVLEASEWDDIVNELQLLFERTQPAELIVDLRNAKDNVSVEEDEESDLPVGLVRQKGAVAIAASAAIDTVSTESKINFQVVRTKCVSQLLLIELLEDLVGANYLSLTTEQMTSLRVSLGECFAFAHAFNSNIDLRVFLWRAGYMSQVPNLLRQEMTSLRAMLRIMFWFHLDTKRDPTVHAHGGESNDKLLFQRCKDVLQSYVLSASNMNRSTLAARDAYAGEDSSNHAELQSMVPIVSFILESLEQVSSERLADLWDSMHELFLGLLEFGNYEVRAAAIRFMQRRIPRRIEATALLQPAEMILPRGIYDVAVVYRDEADARDVLRVCNETLSASASKLCSVENLPQHRRVEIYGALDLSRLEQALSRLPQSDSLTLKIRGSPGLEPSSSDE